MFNCGITVPDLARPSRLLAGSSHLLIITNPVLPRPLHNKVVVEFHSHQTEGMIDQDDARRDDNEEAPTLVASNVTSSSSITLRETTQCVACNDWFPSMSRMMSHLSQGQCGLCLCDEGILEKALSGYVKTAYENLYGLEYNPRSLPRCKECRLPFITIPDYFSHLEDEAQCSNSLLNHDFAVYLRRYTTGKGPRSVAERGVVPVLADLCPPDPVNCFSQCPFCHKAFPDSGKAKGRYFRHLENHRCKAKHFGQGDTSFAFEKYVACCPRKLYGVGEVDRGADYICPNCGQLFMEFSELAVHVEKKHTYESTESMAFINDFKFFLHHSKWEGAGQRLRCRHTRESDWDI